MTVPSPVLVKRRRRLWLVAAALCLALAAAGAVYYWLRPRSSDAPPVASAPLPPLTTSPFLNTRPEVAYVGDERCAGCHEEQSQGYHQHPMGRSMFTAADAPAVEQYGPKTHNPFQVGAFHFQAVRQGPRLIHKEWCQDAQGKVVAELEADIAYVVGSGTQARSYLFQRDGFLFQSPITWYTHASEWNLSPGYEPKALLHFNRRIESRCLYCHCQEAHPVAGSVNHYRDPPFGQLAIGCERCHGPGQLHVAARAQGPPAGPVDDTIVNPRHLAPALREAVCEQCHLQGEDIIVRRGRSQTEYRPGLPLHEYVTVFVRSLEAADTKKIVGHVEQMHLSTCFAKSDGKFGCSSCHHPHAVPAADEKVTFYRQRCLACHGASPPAKAAAVKAPGCSLSPAERLAKDARDNCLICHMPRNPSSNVTHMAVTDHRVLRRPEEPAKEAAGGALGDVPLVAFHRSLLPAKDEELPRDLALALVDLAALADSFGAQSVRNGLTQRALPLLDKAVARAPDDVPALAAHGFALFAQRKLDPALQALDGALAKAPDYEEALGWAALAAEANDRLDLAVKYAQRLVEVSPQRADHYHRLALLQAKREAWPQALQAAHTAVQKDPFRAESRSVLISALLETGDRAGAEAEFAVLGVIHPNYQKSIQAWFAKRLRETK